LAHLRTNRPRPAKTPGLAVSFATMTEDTGTWHYGLIARWWAEFNQPEPEEVAYYGAAVRRFGQPALDLGCGTGRIMLPLLREGLDVDGVDVSPDMIEHARRLTGAAGFQPGLTAQALHELDLPRTYRTIYVCGVFGIGGRRDQDREALRRVYRHLEPGGALILWQELPWAGLDEARWARWLPGHRDGIPREWPTEGDRKRTADGDEIELITRLASFDPLVQRHSLQMRARLWRDGVVIREEASSLSENLYFAPEILLMLEEAGFRDIAIEAAYRNRPATADDDTVIFVARRGDFDPT
jgi:SAM-dependent methyltransferase